MSLLVRGVEVEERKGGTNGRETIFICMLVYVL